MDAKVLNYINRLEGMKTLITNIHFSAHNMSEHKLCDDIMDGVSDFQDNIAEDAQAIYGQLEIGDLMGIRSESTSLVGLLIELRSMIIDMKSTLTENMYTGIINECDDMFHKVNTYIYLARICEKGE